MNWAKTLGWLASGAVIALLLVFLVRYFCEAYRARPKYAEKLLRKDVKLRGKIRWGRVVLTVALAYIASRLFFFLAALGYAAYLGEAEEWLERGLWNWIHWDAFHYIGLIENWYVNEGDPRFHIVFFPLYPLICRGLHLAGMPARASAFFVSNLATVASGFALYGIVRQDSGAKSAERAVWFFMLNPVSFFTSLPFSEGVFLAMTLFSVLFARKRKFALAVLFGALAANARMLGMATAIPIFWEMLRQASEKYSGRELVKKSLLSVLRVLPVAAGLLLYLALNYQVTGDALRFLTYQSEHWSQEFGSVHNTMTYTFECMLNFGNENYRNFVFWPQYVACWLVLGVFCLSWKKLHPGDAAYGLVYFVCAISPTWLLSGTRYLSVMYPLYPALAHLTKKPAAKWAVLAAELLAGVYLSAGYAVIGGVI